MAVQSRENARTRSGALFSALVFAAATLAPAQTPPPDLAKRFDADIHVLASDEMEGRGLGTKGIEKAGDWIETRLKTIGLQPAFGTSYRQPFEGKTGVAIADGHTPHRG